jgi:transcription elongation factor GreA
MHIENPTLGEAVAGYLIASSPKVDETQRQELNNFIRWFGAGKVVSSSNFKENDVADYGESLSPSDTDYRERVEAIKGFLSHARKEGWLSENLAAKVKIRKARNVSATARQHEVKKVPMTRDGFETMQKELEELKTRRVKVIEDIRRAAADKDLKENAPYHAAREQKSYLDGRIMEIEETLKVANVIDEKQNDGLRVNVGNTVKLKDIESGEEVKYALVSPREVDPFEGKISNSSPMGKAVMGHRQGDTVEVTVPSGRKFHYLIKEISR